MRRTVLALTIAALWLMTLASTTLARATTTSFTATETTVHAGVPDRQWVSGHILHVRGEVDTGTLSGGLVGTITTTINVDVDQNTGRGTVHGAFVIMTASETWTGAFSGTIGATTGTGQFVGHGNHGTKIMGTFTQTTPTTFVLRGRILDPHG
jgi:hypothetical protein